MAGGRNKKLGRETGQRQSLLCSLTESLVEHDQIRTTRGRAEAVQPFVEKLITKAKEGDDQATRRQLTQKLEGRKELANALVEDIAPRFQDRPGGYTRVIKLPPRSSDGAEEAVIAFVDHEIT